MASAAVKCFIDDYEGCTLCGEPLGEFGNLVRRGAPASEVFAVLGLETTPNGIVDVFAQHGCCLVYGGDARRVLVSCGYIAAGDALDAMNNGTNASRRDLSTCSPKALATYYAIYSSGAGGNTKFVVDASRTDGCFDGLSCVDARKTVAAMVAARAGGPLSAG